MPERDANQLAAADDGDEFVIHTEKITREYDIPADAVLHIYWCPKCQKQIDKLWHTARRGPALIPQLDEEHYGVRVPVVTLAAAVARVEAQP